MKIQDEEYEDDLEREQAELTARARELLANPGPGTMPFIESLDPLQSRLLATGVIEESLHPGMLVWILQSLGGRYPAEALELFEDLEEWLSSLGVFKNALTSMLMTMAKEEPDLAIRIFLERLGDVPHLAEEESDSLKCSMIWAAAPGDPARALSLMEKMEIQSEGYRRFAASGIGGRARTAKEKTEVLHAMRKYITAAPEMLASDVRFGVLRGLGAGLAGTYSDDRPHGADDLLNFAAGTSWFETAELDEEEASLIAGALGFPRDLADTGKWLEWLSGRIPAGRLAAKAEVHMEWWARNDCDAAAKWLRDSSARLSADP